MIATCPNCATRFRIDSAALGAGRNVRCRNCGHVWFQAPEGEGDAEPRPVPPVEPVPQPEPQTEPVPVPQPEDETPPVPVPPRVTQPDDSLHRRIAERHSQRQLHETPPPRRRRRRIGGWLALIVVVAILAAGFVLAREPIVTFWPPAERLYERAGLVDPAPVFDLRNVRSWREMRDGTDTLLISGEVLNQGGAGVLPPVTIVLRDSEGNTLETFPVEMTGNSVQSGGVETFETAITRWPEAASDIDVVIAGDDGD